VPRGAGRRRRQRRTPWTDDAIAFLGRIGRVAGGPARRGALLVAVLALAAATIPPPGARAQEAADPPPRGITVVGYGKASAPAATAVLQLVASQEEMGPPRAPDPRTTPGAQEREAVGPMVDALTAAGVPDEDIAVVVGVVVGGFYGPGGRASPASTSPSPTRRRRGSAS
jgi:hypothetical protein